MDMKMPMKGGGSNITNRGKNPRVKRISAHSVKKKDSLWTKDAKKGQC